MRRSARPRSRSFVRGDGACDRTGAPSVDALRRVTAPAGRRRPVRGCESRRSPWPPVSDRCSQTPPHPAPSTITLPRRMNQVSSVNTTPMVPYVLLSSMTTVEKLAAEKKKLAAEKKASPSQRTAVTSAGRITRRHDTRPSSRKCIVHAKKIATTTNVSTACTTGPAAWRSGPVRVPSAIRTARRMAR